MGEPLEVRLDEPAGSLDRLRAGARPEEVATRWPSCLTAWALLGDAATRDEQHLQAYAFYRVGYHRGLDRLRASGWRGTGAVPWAHEANRGFLISLRGLGRAAAALGEHDEAHRCEAFLRDLAPDAPASGD